MNGSTLGLLLVLALSGQQALQVTIGAPPRSAPPSALEIEWTDAEGQPLREETVRVEGSKLRLDPPAGAGKFRVVGGGFASRAFSLEEAVKQLVVGLEPSGSVRLSGLRGREGSLTFSFTASAEAKPASPFEVVRPSPIREREIVLRPSDNGKLSVELPPGNYVVAVDAGSDLPPAVFSDINVGSGAVVDLAMPQETGRALTVVARDRDSGKPLREAALAIDEKSRPFERLLLTVLKKRAGLSGEDGRLQFGRVSTGELAWIIGAPNRRSAALRLPPGKDPESKEVRLAPYQSIRVALTGLPRGEPRPAVVVGRCDVPQTWMPCKPKTTTTRRLEDNDRAVVPSAAPGRTGVSLDWGGDHVIRRVADVSSRSEDPDALDVEVALDLWHLRGRTLLHDGRPVEATVLAMSTGHHPSVFGQTSSSPDGTFDLAAYVALDSESTLLLSALSTSPKGSGRWFLRQPIADGYAGQDDIEVVVKSGEFRVRLRDRKTEEAIPRCPVAVRILESNGGNYTSIESDDEGLASFSSIGTGTVRFLPRCDGYAQGSGASFSYEEGDAREETIFLDRAQDIVLTVLDRSGIPVYGAHIQGLDMGNFHGAETRMYINSFLQACVEIGSTGPDGKLLIKGSDWADVGFFVVATGKALTAARFPSRCESDATCSQTVTMSDPNAFPGLLLRPSPSGVSASPFAIFFETLGLPVPASVIREAAGLNGVTRDVAFQATSEGFLCLLPMVLAEGDYDLIIRGQLDPKKGVAVHRLGRFHVPAVKRAVFVTPDDVATLPR